MRERRKTHRQSYSKPSLNKIDVKLKGIFPDYFNCAGVNYCEADPS